ncbi:MAG: response regulator [Candidatus Thermoplasmatota archaeon]|jgi:CheY-like chemotaxis protein
MTEPHRLRLLFVDDSPADREFLAMAFRRKFPAVDVKLAEDANSTMALLRGFGPNLQAQGPNLVLMDLKIPGKDGIAILKEIRADPALHHLPVVMLTSSRLEEDIARSYDAGANAYIPKPADALGYGDLAADIHRFWADVSLLPGALGA